MYIDRLRNIFGKRRGPTFQGTNFKKSLRIQTKTGFLHVLNFMPLKNFSCYNLLTMRSDVFMYNGGLITYYYPGTGARRREVFFVFVTRSELSRRHLGRNRLMTRQEEKFKNGFLRNKSIKSKVKKGRRNEEISSFRGNNKVQNR